MVNLECLVVFAITGVPNSGPRAAPDCRQGKMDSPCKGRTIQAKAWTVRPCPRVVLETIRSELGGCSSSAWLDSPITRAQE
jgi:hypothetical protein